MSFYCNVREGVRIKLDYHKVNLTYLISQDISLYRDQWNGDTDTNQFEFLCEVLAFINQGVNFWHAVFRNDHFNTAFTLGISELRDLILDRARFYSE